MINFLVKTFGRLKIEYKKGYGETIVFYKELFGKKIYLEKNGEPIYFEVRNQYFGEGLYLKFCFYLENGDWVSIGYKKRKFYMKKIAKFVNQDHKNNEIGNFNQ